MVMSASFFSGFPADARILGLDIGSISVDVVLLDGLGTPLYSRYVRHHGQPDKVLCAELEALERTHAGIAAAVTGALILHRQSASVSYHLQIPCRQG